VAAVDGPRLLIMGPPGSGKGTQAEVLAERLDVPAISTGEMLRGEVAEGTELGKRVESTLEEGALVDDETMAAVVRRRLAKEDARRGFLLDGYPRTAGQAGTLERILGDQGAELDAVVVLEVPEQELVNRALGRRRADDSEEVIRRRLEVYREKTEPVVSFYRRRSLVREVDGHRSRHQVTQAILGALGRGA
jgi:adenylate kinase